MKLKIVSLLLLSFFEFTYTQTITGVILDKATNLPIEGASIYFDNTTIGTISRSNGEFSIEKDTGVKSDLVISFLGYQKIVISNPEPNKSYTVLMEESSFSLDEVVITDDDWPRKLKLKEFRKHFLGTTKNGKSCTILNEDELIIKYNKKTKMLTAVAYQPLQIKNKNLDYLINYDLQDFEVSYSYVKGIQERVYRTAFFSGTSFFQPIEDITKKRIEKNREEAFKGSVLHFMRALSRKSLTDEKFEIYKRGFQVNPDDHIQVNTIDSLNAYRVKIPTSLSILYKRNQQSKITPNFVEFAIDNNGNHYPPDAVNFSGALAERRFGDSLPLDYKIED